jgi:diguanylate cyclase (GGDEF)-like protein
MPKALDHQTNNQSLKQTDSVAVSPTDQAHGNGPMPPLPMPPLPMPPLPMPPLMMSALEALATLSRDLASMSRAVASRENELTKLLDLVQTVECGVSPEDVLGNMFESFSGVIPFERIGCAFLADGGKRVVAYWSKSELGPVQIQPNYSQLLAGSSLETVLATGQPRIINDLEEYLARKPQSDATRRIVAEGGRSSLTCPLVFDGCPLGFLFFTSREKDVYKDVHQYIFRQIASQVASAIEKSRLFQKLAEQNRSLIKKSEQLEVVATHDALTGILNRGAIDDALRGAFSRYKRSRQPFGVIMADIDHFKQINDKLGHSAGDLVLRECARRMSSVMRKTDAIGRYGGEEFVFVIEDTEAGPLMLTAERLRGAVSDQAFDLPACRQPVTVSLGAALIRPGVTSAADLTRLADLALYQAKANGRNRSVVSDS